MSARLELEQIQGLVLNGYKKHLSARYGIFEITDRLLACRWIGKLLPDVQFGEFRRTHPDQAPFPKDCLSNIALSHAGFAALGLHHEALVGFSHAFQEGLNDPSRARRMGDDGDSDPRSWAWGKPGDPVHGVLAVFSVRGGPAGARELGEFLERNFDARTNGVRLLAHLDTSDVDPELRREHFGFRDGIANPRLKGLARPGAEDQVADGEFLLGYENGYGKVAMSPELPSSADPGGKLPPSDERPDFKDFGRNGSYLVFRQLSQDVHAFWEFVYAAKDEVPGIDGGAAGAEWLASRMVGRWQNGTPITHFPRHPGPERYDDMNRFLYHHRAGHQDTDAFGSRCPFGSHIRRTNPRDTTLPAPYDVELSGSPEDPGVIASRLRLSNLHRIMRRGRAYGPPSGASFDPEVLRKADDQPRGLHFLCFNANLARQFEFVQSNWALNPAFAGMSSDPDPLLAAGRAVPFPADTFTMQGCPPRRVHGVPRVVEVRGGAYFFMPSRAALEYLAQFA
jgi:Dyp-type peroxidase family